MPSVAVRIQAATNAVADTDITVVLRGPAALATGRAALTIAGSPAHATDGATARALEPAPRRLRSIAGRALEPAGEAGAVQLLTGGGDVVLRYSHLDGDAWSAQELVLAAAQVAGELPDGPWCDCAGWLGRRAGPRSLVEARLPEARFGRAAWRAAARAVNEGLAGDPRTTPRLPDGPDEVCVVRLETPPPARASRFSRTAGQVVTWLGEGPVRVTYTVNLRRHEPALAGAPAGNLVVLGQILTRPGGTEQFEAALRAQLAARIWLHHLVVERALGRLPDRLLHGVLRAARERPISTLVLTQLWTETTRPCSGCGATPRPRPPGLEVLVVPPATPGAVNVGLTRTGDDTIAVVRGPGPLPTNAPGEVLAAGEVGVTPLQHAEGAVSSR